MGARGCLIRVLGPGEQQALVTVGPLSNPCFSTVFGLWMPVATELLVGLSFLH